MQKDFLDFAREWKQEFLAMSGLRASALTAGEDYVKLAGKYLPYKPFCL
jgi:hypothetical protein